MYSCGETEVNPNRLTIVPASEFRNTFGKKVCPGSVNYSGGILTNSAGCDIDRCSWVDVIHLVMRSNVFDQVFGFCHELIDNVELSDGEFVIFSPRFSRSGDVGRAHLAACEECGRGSIFGEINDRADLFYVGNTNAIGVSRDLLSKIRARADWFGKDGDIRLAAL